MNYVWNILNEAAKVKFPKEKMISANCAGITFESGFSILPVNHLKPLQRLYLN